MKIVNSQTTLAHPKLFASLLAGFDAITTHVLLIVFPLVLDFTIWVGPSPAGKNTDSKYLRANGQHIRDWDFTQTAGSANDHRFL